MTTKKLWFNTFILSMLIFLTGSTYLFARRGTYNLYIANKVLATTALILIGLSFALSGICYFWNLFDKKIIYRQYLGLVGFAFAVIHGAISLFFLPQQFSFPSWFIQNWLMVALGLLALIIFAFVGVLSLHKQTLRWLGGQKWRVSMRYFGYTALFLVILHFTLVKYNGWLKWLTTFKPLLPPLSLIGFVLTMSILILRLFLWLSSIGQLKKNSPTSGSFPKKMVVLTLITLCFG